MTAAHIILDSISATGVRLTTMEVTFHRFVLSELNTHRKFSRNSASSRAIPSRKMRLCVRKDPARPISWPLEKPGMSGGAEMSGARLWATKAVWDVARFAALGCAWVLGKLGLHKSLTNRILESFMWHTAIISSTEWENFFAQRCSPLAQPEIRVLAEAMREALANSTPVLRTLHAPYIQADEQEWVDDKKCRVSSARCGRVSYLTHAGIRDSEEDVAMFSRLISATPPHWSPLEHVASSNPNYIKKAALGNFDGWAQLRHSLPGNITDIKTAVRHG